MLDDDAFAKIEASVMEDLLQDIPNDNLAIESQFKMICKISTVAAVSAIRAYDAAVHRSTPQT